MLSGLVGLDGLVPDASWLDDFELEEGIKRLQATGRSATFIVRATMSEEREDVVQPVACQSEAWLCKCLNPSLACCPEARKSV